MVSAQAALVNWTLDMGHSDEEQDKDKLQMEIVYSPVQARCVSRDISFILFDLLKFNKTEKNYSSSMTNMTYVLG